MSSSPQRCEPPEEWREKDRWHWLRRRISGQRYSEIYKWEGAWLVGNQIVYPEKLAAEYIAPVLTPDEIAEREAAAYQRGQREMRKRAAERAFDHKPDYVEVTKHAERLQIVRTIAADIDALPIKEKPE